MNDRAEKRHKATASDVAQRAGVSKWTVSRAFTPGASVSEQAKERVLAAAQELGYRPNLLARSLKNRRTNLIGIVADELKNPHSMMMMDGVTQGLQQRGYIGLMLNIASGDNYRSVMSLADQLQVAGLLFLGTALTPELISLAREMHDIPLVQICRNAEVPDIPVVNVDGYRAGLELGKLLVAQGCQRFGYMKGPDKESTHLLRLEGFSDAISAAGFSLNSLMTAGNYDRKRAYQQMVDYLAATPAAERIDGLFCENDILALGALSALRQAGVEQQVAVVGFDDIDEASDAEWQLTTWSQQLDLLIEEALNRLLDGNASVNGEWCKGAIRLRRSHLKQP